MTPGDTAGKVGWPWMQARISPLLDNIWSPYCKRYCMHMSMILITNEDDFVKEQGLARIWSLPLPHLPQPCVGAPIEDTASFPLNTPINLWHTDNGLKCCLKSRFNRFSTKPPKTGNWLVGWQHLGTMRSNVKAKLSTAASLYSAANVRCWGAKKLANKQAGGR